MLHFRRVKISLIIGLVIVFAGLSLAALFTKKPAFSLSEVEISGVEVEGNIIGPTCLDQEEYLLKKYGPVNQVSSEDLRRFIQFRFEQAGGLIKKTNPTARTLIVSTHQSGENTEFVMMLSCSRDGFSKTVKNFQPTSENFKKISDELLQQLQN